jgi:hypothetical protein
MHLMCAVVLIGLLVWSSTDKAQAYLWRCHTPAGDIWTDQAGHSGDCEEYDPVFNPAAALPQGKSLIPQLRQPPSEPPSVLVAPPPPFYPWASYDPWFRPYPYAPYYFYPYYPAYRPYYGAGLFLGPPPLMFHFGGSRWRRF